MVKATGWIVGGIFAAILVTGLMVYFISSSTSQEVIQTTTANAEESNDACGAANPAVDLQWRVINDEASTSATYLYATLYLEELDANGNAVAMSSVTGGNVTTRTTSTNALKCGKAYRLDLQTAQDGTVNALTTPVLLSKAQTQEDPVIVDIHSTNFSTIQMRAYDVVDDGYMDSNETTSNATTDWEVPSASNYWASTSADTAKTVAADDSYMLRFEVKTVQADAQFGSKAIMCVNQADDSNANDWDIPVVTVNGVNLPDMRGSMSSNDILATTGMEYCFDVGVIGETFKTINFDMPTGAGTNPNFDYSIRFYALGTYEDDDHPGVLLHNVVARTDSGRTELATATAQSYSFMIT